MRTEHPKTFLLITDYYWYDSADKLASSDGNKLRTKHPKTFLLMADYYILRRFSWQVVVGVGALTYVLCMAINTTHDRTRVQQSLLVAIWPVRNSRRSSCTRGRTILAATGGVGTSAARDTYGRLGLGVWRQEELGENNIRGCEN
jgi:hypothetical protein